MEKLLEDLNIRFETNVPLGPHTWYGIGGPARVLAHPSSIQQLAALAARCHDAGVNVFVLGSGANLLVLDQGVEGVVVKLDDPCFRQCRIDKNVVTAGGGYDLAKLVLATSREGLSGLESLAGIPASVGGAVRMNAGGAFGDIGQAVRRVEVMDVRGQVYYRDRDDLAFEYRRSNIVAKYILSVDFDVVQDDPDELIKRVKEIFLYKKNTQPLVEHSAGCAFKNPMAEVVPAGMPASAGALIDRAGLKGHTVGGASVSHKHANFIVTEADAKASDVLALIEHIQAVVMEKYAVALEREVVVWP